jgi:hypothetical protein
MSGAEIVTRVSVDTIDTVLKGEIPVLVACIRDNRDYPEIIEEIESVAVFTGPDIRVCYALEDLLPYLENRFRVTGTPTFLLISHGELQDSLLGKTSIQDLMTFIRNHVPSLDTIPSSLQRDVRRPGQAHPRKRATGSAAHMAAERRRRN